MTQQPPVEPPVPPAEGPAFGPQPPGSQPPGSQPLAPEPLGPESGGSQPSSPSSGGPQPPGPASVGPERLGPPAGGAPSGGLPPLPGPGAVPGSPTPQPHQLIRPREGRILGGVCAGLADLIGVDVLLVRIGFVVLATIGGAGVLAYVALWLLTPSIDRPARIGPNSSRSVRSLLLLGLVAVVAIALVAGAAHGPGLALVLLAAIAIAALANRRRLLVLGLVLLLAVVAAGTVAAVGSALSSRSYAVSNADDLQTDYDLAAGTMRLDLTGLQLSGERTVSARVGSGDLIVRIPSTLAVRVHARAGVGGVHILGRDSTGIAPQQDRDGGPSPDPSTGTRLVLDLAVGAGTVTVQAAS